MQLPLKLRARLAIRTILKLLTRPRHLAVALIGAAITAEILVWIFNFSLLIDVLGSSIGLLTKLSFLAAGLESLFTNFEPLQSIVLITFAVLSGLNIMLGSYVAIAKAAAQLKVSQAEKGLGATAAAIIGAGCAACGTGLLGPVLAGIGAGSSILLVQFVGTLANLAGLALMLYSILGLSATAATELAKEQQKPPTLSPA